MKEKSYNINEHGSDGEEISHEEQQHQTDIAPKRPCETTGSCSKLHIRFRLQKSRESMTMESR